MGYKRTVRYGSPGGSLLLRFFILASPGENTTSYVGILWKLRLALVVCFIVRNLRLAYVVSFGFLNEEYLIALVDFKETAFGLCRLFFIRNRRFAVVVCLGFLP